MEHYSAQKTQINVRTIYYLYITEADNGVANHAEMTTTTTTKQRVITWLSKNVWVQTAAVEFIGRIRTVNDAVAHGTVAQTATICST